MLDPEIPDERRDQITDEARKRISSSGELKHDQTWGMRKMAYEIRQRTEADYRFFRFDAQSPLLDELDHNLKITDGVLRFRIFKVDPRSPAIEPPPPVSLAASAPRGAPGRRGGPGGRRDAARRPRSPTRRRRRHPPNRLRLKSPQKRPRRPTLPPSRSPRSPHRHQRRPIRRRSSPRPRPRRTRPRANSPPSAPAAS